MVIVAQARSDVFMRHVGIQCPGSLSEDLSILYPVRVITDQVLTGQIGEGDSETVTE